MLGAENAETLLNRFTAALAQGENAEFAAAEKELKDILAIRERLFGPHDLSVLRTCYQLGRVLGGDNSMRKRLSTPPARRMVWARFLSRTIAWSCR